MVRNKGVGNAKSKEEVLACDWLNKIFRRINCSLIFFQDAVEGMDHTVEGGVHQPNVLIPDGAQPELDRPTKIRKIDQYCQPECPCCNMSKRYTQAWMVAIGFIISFGIR